MKSGLLFSRFFMALISTVDFQTIGIKLSLKITNRIVEKICSAYLLFALQISLLQAYCLYVLQGMILSNYLD